MSFLHKYIQDDNLKSLLISIMLHAVVFIILVIGANISNSGYGIPMGSGGEQGMGYYAAEIEGEKNEVESPEETTPQEEKNPVDVKSEEKILDKSSELISKESKPIEKPTGRKGTGNDAGLGSGKFSNYGPGFGDTTNLKNVYSEKTLNVRIHYPSGWTFVDQNVKNKLDGVTFWSNYGNLDPPPYIFLEVADKYIFDERRYKKKLEMDDFTLYYNDPESMSGQVKQTVYIRTDTDEDYIIKLMIKGETEFKAFQPEFFGMIKTFKFGKSWF